MNFHAPKHAISLVVATVIIAAAGLAGAVDPDWKAVEQALGKPGQKQTGDVGHAETLLHAFLGDRRSGEACPGTQGGPRQNE